MIKSRTVRWAERVARVVGRGGINTVCWWEDLKERNHLEDLGVDGRILLKWIFKTWIRKAWTATGTGGRSM